jgi:hypothetical protein
MVGRRHGRCVAGVGASRGLNTYFGRLRAYFAPEQVMVLNTSSAVYVLCGSAPFGQRHVAYVDQSVTCDLEAGLSRKAKRYVW